LPRANSASTAVEQRGPGQRAPCGVIARQARHTRSPWLSSHASGGAATVDRCTERRWETNDCRQLNPVGEAPSRRAHRGIGQNHIPEGGWKLWTRAVIGRCWVGMGASPAQLMRACQFPWGPSLGAGRPVYPPASPRVSVPVRFPSVPPGGHVGHPLCPPACPRVQVTDSLPSLPPGGAMRREPQREVPPALGCPNWIAPPPAVGRASGVSRRGAHRGGAGSGSGPGGRDAHRWPRWMEALHVPPALRLHVRAPQKQAICVAVGRHELRARVQAPGCQLWVRLPHGRGRGQGLLGLRP